MTWGDRFLRSLFVACAVGLGWGIRGDFGHVIGAMYPGAALGLAWVFVMGRPWLLSRMPVIAGLTAAAIGAGGTMSYGILHGYAQADTLRNYAYGFFTLFCQGGCWGTFGCALAGLLVERRPMRTGDWLGLIGCVFLGGWLAMAIIVDLVEFHVNPPRNDISVAFLGAAIGQFVWLIFNNRPLGLRGAVFGFLGFGFGMAGGRLLANAFRHLEQIGWGINHWNVMEVTCGFVGGFVFTWTMLRVVPTQQEADSEETQSLRWPNAIGASYVLGLIPLWHLSARIPERMTNWVATMKGHGVTNPEDVADRTLWLVILVTSLGGCAGLIWAGAILRNRRWPAGLPILILSLIMLLFQNLTAHYFWYPYRPQYLNMHNLFWILFAGIAVGSVLLRPETRPVTEVLPPALSGFRVAIVSLLVFAGILIVAAFTNGERTMKSANTRWPQWTWNQGPFPGAAEVK